MGEASSTPAPFFLGRGACWEGLICLRRRVGSTNAAMSNYPDEEVGLRDMACYGDMSALLGTCCAGLLP